MSIAIVWFRQDLRLDDNPALFEACSQHKIVIPIYILDKKHSILGGAQAWWLHHSLKSLSAALSSQLGLKLILRQGEPLNILLELLSSQAITALYWNRCYEPLLMERDKKIKVAVRDKGIEVLSFNGSLLHEPWMIKNKSGDYFKVFTPYWRTCKEGLFPPAVEKLSKHAKGLDIVGDAIDDWGLLPTVPWASQFPDFWKPGENGAKLRLETFIDCHLDGYKKDRDFPAKDATSRLSPHLHFGEISPWTIVRSIEAVKLDPRSDLASAEHFLSELGWREFSYYLLYHVPGLPSKNFKQAFDAFPWQNDQQLLACWQKGTTGYPLIDAGMRELWATGYMHNRVRMVVASFLTKGLFIDWRKGAGWFLDTLVDADLANNSASWQWVAGSGADAAPYFRIFNPVLQSEKFDPDGAYIRRWIPELSSLSNHAIHAPWQAKDADRIYAEGKYPRPIVDHSESRARALAYYKQLNKGGTS